jgi:hypothetical protein
VAGRCGCPHAHHLHAHMGVVHVGVVHMGGCGAQLGACVPTSCVVMLQCCTGAQIVHVCIGKHTHGRWEALCMHGAHAKAD